MTTQPTILAVGADGKFAGLIVPELAKRGARVRVLVRHAEHQDAVLQRGATEVAVGDLTDTASLRAALAGVDSVFYIAPAFIPNETEVGVNMVQAAVVAVEVGSVFVGDLKSGARGVQIPDVIS